MIKPDRTRHTVGIIKPKGTIAPSQTIMPFHRGFAHVLSEAQKISEPEM